MNMISAKDIIPLVDLTSLNTIDNSKSIQKFIDKANLGFENTYPASVCVYPKFAEQLKKELSTNIKTCAVSTYFPSSQSPLELKLYEINYLDKIGIDEIDIVLPIGDFLAGRYQSVYDELRAIREHTSRVVKLIIETSLIKNQQLISKATEIGIEAGMDFIKTSTGKVTLGADIQSVQTILNMINNRKTNTGLKVSGGIRTKSEAIQFLNIASQAMGINYINPKTFRFGASTLYDNLILRK